MGAVFKPLFEFLTGDIVVCGNVVYNYLIMLIVGEIAYQLSFRCVHNAYHSGVINGKFAGSILHWTIRVIFYTVTAYLIRGVIWLSHLISDIPNWVWWSALGVILIVMIGAMVIGIIRSKGREK